MSSYIHKLLTTTVHLYLTLRSHLPQNVDDFKLPKVKRILKLTPFNEVFKRPRDTRLPLETRLSLYHIYNTLTIVGLHSYYTRNSTKGGDFITDSKSSYSEIHIKF